MHESLRSKLREDLSINCNEIQSLSIEISSIKCKNVIPIQSTGHLEMI